MAAEPGWPPISFFEENGDYLGISVDYIRLIERRLGVRFKIEKMTGFQDILDKAQGNQIDVIMEIMATPERSQYLNFTKPYLKIPSVILTRSNFAGPATLADMAGKKVAISSGFAVIDYLKANYPDLQLVEVPDSADGLRRLATGEYDAMVVELPAASYITAKEGLTNLRVAGFTGHEYNLAIGSRKDLPILNRILDKGLAMISPAERESIYRKWVHLEFQPFYRNKTFIIVALSGLGIIVLLISAILIWNQTLKRQVRARTQDLHNELNRRRQAEGLAKENERKLLTLLGNLQGMAYRCLNDREWTMLFLSEGCYELTGYSPVDLIQNSTVAFCNLIHPDDQEYVQCEVQQAIEHNLPFKISYRIRTASGQEKWVYEQGVRVAQHEDGSDLLEGFITDITNMELAKKELTEKIHLLALSSEVGTNLSREGTTTAALQQCSESLVSHLNAAFARIWLINTDDQVLELKASTGLYTHINGGHSRIPIGKNMIGWIAENKKPLFTNSVIGDPLVHDQAWAKRENMVSFAGQPLMVADKIVGVMALFARHPLTEYASKSLASAADGIAMGVERKQYEEALSLSQTRLKTLVKTIPDLFWLKDRDGVYLACNFRFEKFFGAKESEIVGKTDYDFVSKELADFFREKDQAAILAGQPSMNEEEVTFADDGHQEFLETIKTPVIDDQGKIIGVLGIARDITERKKAAEIKEAMETRLRQSQKMESIGTLAGGIAHDFNNILAAIYGYSEFALEDIAQPDILRKDLEQIFKGAERAKNLVQQILTFSRKTEHEKRALQISLVVKEALKLLRASIPSTIDIRQNISSEAIVLTDPTQIHQVVINLCTNAYHAMRDSGGTLGVALKDIEISRDSAIPELKPGEGRYLQLEISDTGTGMDEEIKSKIFDPYFTTKGIGEGTGLGLAVAHGIVESHGGCINVYSEPGQGTTFHVYFPVYEGERKEVSSNEQGTPLAGGNETIMLVDDDIKIIELVERILGSYGYEVYTFANGVQAYQELQQHPDKYDLIISDMTMPYMTGADLAHKALEMCPGLPIVLCSGHSELINREKALTMGIREYCAKPLNKKQILRTVRKVLDDAKIYGTRILFVDDVQFNVDLGKAVLVRLGCSVTVATSGQEAFGIFSDVPGDFDIIITDLNMPNMTGIELAEKALAIRPDIPILLVTGDQDDLDEKLLVTNAIREVLRKPMDDNNLVSAIRRIIINQS
ncbi:MAG: transporter substrate-binding domain-containing protein [Desulfobacula sp.]|nr:transporter substrate-binding domain-containing protein [Desulfobacula sp.]